MSGQCVITRQIAVAKGVYTSGHLGELTQVLDFDLVDAVAQETGTVQQRTRLLPIRVVIYFVLAPPASPGLEPVIRAVQVCPARAITLGKMPRRYRD